MGKYVCVCLFSFFLSTTLDGGGGRRSLPRRRRVVNKIGLRNQFNNARASDANERRRSGSLFQLLSHARFPPFFINPLPPVWKRTKIESTRKTAVFAVPSRTFQLSPVENRDRKFRSIKSYTSCTQNIVTKHAARSMAANRVSVRASPFTPF